MHLSASVHNCVAAGATTAAAVQVIFRHMHPDGQICVASLAAVDRHHNIEVMHITDATQNYTSAKTQETNSLPKVMSQMSAQVVCLNAAPFMV